ncbi:DUF3025 domain-containing protein [Limnohabitans sp. JirII-31]|uniref:DUF3025 domain-containing protein n=1 Tax=Limnohabitans sp. JirII-31 TaxID=1977908 RepID=UPI001E35E706|nr:DUF3025 domain-containing protein [Limnohabitans sp. JirII-31]
MARGLTPAPSTFAGVVLADIDWAQPWFAPWQHPGEHVAQDALRLHSVAQALNHIARDVQFVAQSELPATQAYEDFIFQQGRVPTRDGLHDFFNGLCWHRFPQTKRRLNLLQAAEIARQGVGATRGPVRDALTLFDENAVLLQLPDALWQALQARDWRSLLVDQRAQWQHVHIVLFGHALLEKLVTPYVSITGHVYRIAPNVDARSDAALDDWLSTDLQPEKLATKPFEPLPVLGVPGWWSANEAPGFYDNTQVFRPKNRGAIASHS